MTALTASLPFRSFAIGCVLLPLLACSSPPSRSADDVWRQAQEAVDRASLLVARAEVEASWRAFQEAEGIVADYIGGDGRSIARVDPQRRQEQVMGRTLADWQHEWRASYERKIRASWPAIRQAMRDESVDIALLKGFVSTYLGRDHVARVNQEYRRLEPIFRSRRATQYWFRCEYIGDFCGIVRLALADRLPAAKLTVSWTGNRDDYQGVVEVDIEVLRQANYTRRNQTTGSLPETARVDLRIRTHAGTSRWDGSHSFELHGDLPPRIRPQELDATARRHWQTLRQELDRQLADWP